MKAFVCRCVFRTLWILMAVGVLHVSADCSYAQHEIFDESVMQKWKDYEAFSHGLQGVLRVHQIVGGKAEEYTVRFKQNRECALAVYPDNRDSSMLICSLGNPHYLARINLSKTDPSYAILRDYTPLPGEREEGLSVFDLVFNKISCHFHCGGRSLRQAVSDPSFTVTKVAKETLDRQELIRVDYMYNYESGGAQVRERGSLWLDPSRCWCIRKDNHSSVESRRKGLNLERQVEIACETIEHPSGFPILKSVKEHFKSIAHQSDVTRRFERAFENDYNLEVNDSIPDSEFTLSAFGLPEPAGTEPVKKPIPMYVWILVAAGVCVALALSFRYLAHRARPKPVV
ncbi:MAG: hypothetical protein ACYC3I_18555 [Gemmataceae bacterium]